MKNLIGKLVAGARKFTAFDFAVFKLALLFIGILLGVYFHDFFVSNIAIVWVLAGVFCVGIVWITLRKSCRG